MKRFRRILSMVLALAMVGSLAACGGGGSGSTVETKPPAAEAHKSPGETSAPEMTAEPKASEDDGETVDLTMAFLIFGTVPNDLEMVNEKINDYLKEKLNVTVTMVPINSSNYAQQIDLMLTSGEKLDLLADGTITAFFNYTNHAGKGQLYPMNELLDTYGQGIKDALGDYVNTASVNGEIYGVATNRDLAYRTSILVLTRLLEKYNIDPDSIKTHEDIEAMCQLIRDNEPNVIPLMVGENANGTIFDSMGLCYDVVGDQLSDLIGVLMDNQKLEVSDYYETPECAAAAQRAREWFQKGYILQDAATNQFSAYDLMKAGKIFGYICSSKPGIEVQTESRVGEDITEIIIADPVSDTQKVTAFMWAIAAQSEHPDKAMQVLNLMYSDPYLVNLFCHGIEGIHYKITDEANQIINYADGLDASTSGYDMNVDFQFGNQLLSYIWEGDSPSLWTDLDSFNKSANVSKALGFQFDTSNVKTEYAAVNAVIDQYKVPLGQGTVDPDKVLPEFIEKLKTAGIEKIITEKQAQLDKFAEEHGLK